MGNIANAAGETPLYAACMYGNGEDNNKSNTILELLLQHKDCEVNRTNNFGETPLFAACRHGRAWIVKSLLKYGANVEYQSDNDKTMTPLSIATLHEHEDIVKLLSQHKNDNAATNVAVKQEQNTTVDDCQLRPKSSSSSNTSDVETKDTATVELKVKDDTIASTTTAPIKKKRKKKKQSYKSMMASMMASSSKENKKDDKEREK